jgi:hypothetical protein
MNISAAKEIFFRAARVKKPSCNLQITCKCREIRVTRSIARAVHAANKIVVTNTLIPTVILVREDAIRSSSNHSAEQRCT